MSNSFEADGFISRLCVGVGDDFAPNVFCGSPYQATIIGRSGPDGNIYFAASYPNAALSLEWWMKFNTFTNINDSGDSVGIGWWRNGSDGTGGAGSAGSVIAAGLELTSTGPQAIRIDGSGTTRSSSITIPRGWHHWAITQDPSPGSDNMITYIDGVVVNTTSISGGSIPAWSPARTPMVHMASGGVQGHVAGWDVSAAADPGGSFPGSLTDPYTTFTHQRMPCVIGPVAFYVTSSANLLTVANMATSMSRRSVGFGTGLVETMDWTAIAWEDTPTWDFNPRHIYRGISDLPDRQIAIPVATNSNVSIGTILFQTLTEYGQDNDLTATTTSTLVAGKTGLRGWCAFMADPFFGTGGGVPPGL